MLISAKCHISKLLVLPFGKDSVFFLMLQCAEKKNLVCARHNVVRLVHRW